MIEMDGILGHPALKIYNLKTKIQGVQKEHTYPFQHHLRLVIFLLFELLKPGV